jgi:hypothetical protein
MTNRRLAGLTHAAVGGLVRLFGGPPGWHPISTAPFNRDLQIRVIGDHGLQVIPFPCRQVTSGWINSDLGVRVELEPVEWRAWPKDS